MQDTSNHNRYARQSQFAPIGSDGQAQIASSHATILGCGALGSVAAELLARAGVGTLRIIDRDVVEWTNLQRQSLFDEQDAVQANSKAAAAAKRLAEINSTIRIDPVVADVTSENIRELLGETDVVLDATDNFAIRFLVNDWSLANRTAWVHGGCVGASGQVRLFDGQGSPCFRCVVPEPPPASSVQTCDTAGVIAPATHLIASLQSAEALKWLSGNHECVRKEILSVDLWTNRIRELSLQQLVASDCIACGQHNLEFLDGTRMHSADGVLCGRNAVQLSMLTKHQVDLEHFARRWRDIGQVQSTPFFVRLFPDEQRSLTLFCDGRVIVEGTSEVAEARVLYDRFVGG